MSCVARTFLSSATPQGDVTNQRQAGSLLFVGKDTNVNPNYKIISSKNGGTAWKMLNNAVRQTLTI